MSMISLGIAYICLGWSSFIAVVQAIAVSRLFLNYSRPPPPPVSPTLPDDEVPHLTIIRPIKGLDTALFACLASAFRQSYPAEKLSIYMCVDSVTDSAYPVLHKLLSDFPKADARIFIEAEDPLLHGPNGNVSNLGPNPKIRNLSRAYREAKGDIVWVVDANVWVGPHVAGRMVDKLCGFLPGGKRAKPYKFVHQLPVVVDIPGASHPSRAPSHDQDDESQLLLASRDDHLLQGTDSAPGHDMDHNHHPGSSLLGRFGGRLEEMFMATTHAKFYSAINSVGVAPCVVGKSNMWRKSHLHLVTDPIRNPSHVSPPPPDHAGLELRGIDYFSRYICEDHMIGDIFFQSALPHGYRRHGLVPGDMAVQPLAHMPVSGYIGRRVRWLRARKWTVLAATLVEPGVESFLCNLYLSFALTTLPWVKEMTGLPQTWRAMGLVWLGGVTSWMVLDWFVFSFLHSGKATVVDMETPRFARGTVGAASSKSGGHAIPRAPKRRFGEWLLAWVGREALALPVWSWAVLFGTTVSWRGKSFKVMRDMSVVTCGTSPPSHEAVDTAEVGGCNDGHGAVRVGQAQEARRTRTPEMEGGLRSRSNEGRRH